MKNLASNNGINSKATDASSEIGISVITQEFQSFVADIEDLVKATTSLTGDDLSKAKAKLQLRIASAKDSAGEIGEAIVNRVRKTGESTNAYVHEQPWTAIGVSAAAGLLMGYLLSRRA